MGATTSKVDLAKKDLETKIALITQKQTELGEKIKHHETQALHFKKKSSKSEAVMHLKLCHSNRATLGKLITMKGNLINVRDNLDMSELMGAVITSMKQSLEALSTLAKGQDAETVNELMDDFNELSLHADEVSKAMAQDISGPGGEYDLEEEYEKLEECISLEAESEPQQEQLSPIKEPAKNVKREERQLLQLLE